MADLKYGRLFTEADVRVMLGIAITEAWEPNVPTLGQITNDTLAVASATFPADEPLFLLRGQDRFAPDGVSGYFDALQIAEDAEGDWIVSEAHRDAVADAGNALDLWQAEHPDRVKVPD